MPKLISEIAAGQQFTRSATEGRLADSQVRTFRILLNQPGETFNVQTACGVRIGDRHPVNQNIYCVSWDAKFEGESRTVILATFNYQSTAASKGEDKNDQSPDVRPANWSTSTSLIEVPVSSWTEIKPGGAGQPEPAVNTVKDMYDGVSKFEAIVTISIEQFEPTDPFRHSLWAGRVNADAMSIGSLSCPPGSLMFRGVQTKPSVESWGGLIYRGWMANYEFAFRRNYVKGLWDPDEEVTYSADIGWDVAVPQTGFNVVCNLNAPNVEKAGMPLKHKSGRIENWPGGIALPDNVAVGQKARAMVLVHEYENGGASQLPSAQPIPLNDDGTPRSKDAEPPVIVRRYRPHGEVNFKALFQLRLE